MIMKLAGQPDRWGHIFLLTSEANKAEVILAPSPSPSPKARADIMSLRMRARIMLVRKINKLLYLVYTQLVLL